MISKIQPLKSPIAFAFKKDTAHIFSILLSYVNHCIKDSVNKKLVFIFREVRIILFSHFKCWEKVIDYFLNESIT